MTITKIMFLTVSSLGLYDKPVVIEGKRERKTTIFLASQTTPQAITIPKPLLFVVG